MTYATLPTTLRNEGTALYSLVRNLGSSFGLSVVIAQVSNKTQTHHAELSSLVTPYETQTWSDSVLDFWSADSPQNLAMLDHAINAQAVTMAYLDGFRLIMLASGIVIPLLFLMRPPDYSTR
jgi:DHA2 family multidrug resistance protein